MSKQRLEEINQLLSDYYENIDDPFSATDNAIEIIEKVGSLLEFVKEQAERVQELEKELINNQKTFLKIELGVKDDKRRLKQQNKRYRETLEFYADEQTYKRRNDPYEPLDTAINDDHGIKARKALGESE